MGGGGLDWVKLCGRAYLVKELFLPMMRRTGRCNATRKKRQMADAAEGLQIGVVLGVSGQAGQASGPSRTTTSKASKPSASV